MNIVYRALTALCVVALASAAWAAELIYRPVTPAEHVSTNVATMGGQPALTLRDLNDGFAVPYYEAMVELHRRQLAWIRTQVTTQLVALAASARNQSAEQFLEAEVLAATTDPRQRDAARAEYMEKVWRDANVTIDLPAPAPPRLFVSEFSKGPVTGGHLGDAPISVIEFCSFTSAECREGWKRLRDAMKQFGSRLRIAHRDYPARGDGTALTAAIAARCAHRQGSFWSYQDLLYENQGRVGDPVALKAFARTLGLATGVFDQCLDRRETAEEVGWDIQEAERVSVMRMPTLFVNGVYIGGVLPTSELVALLQRYSL